MKGPIRLRCLEQKVMISFAEIRHLSSFEWVMLRVLNGLPAGRRTEWDDLAAKLCIHESEFLRAAVTSLIELDLIEDRNPETPCEDLDFLNITEEGIKALAAGYITISEIFQDVYELYFKSGDLEPIRSSNFLRHEIPESHPQKFKPLALEKYQEALNRQCPDRVDASQTILKVEPLNQIIVTVELISQNARR